LRKEITPAEVPQFVSSHGMPGFSPTQGHIASAIPFLGHTLDRMLAGTMKRAMFLAKGSLFLGRMTQMADGVSFILESQGRQLVCHRRGLRIAGTLWRGSYHHSH